VGWFTAGEAEALVLPAGYLETLRRALLREK